MARRGIFTLATDTRRAGFSMLAAPAPNRRNGGVPLLQQSLAEDACQSESSAGTEDPGKPVERRVLRPTNQQKANVDSRKGYGTNPLPLGKTADEKQKMH